MDRIFNLRVFIRLAQTLNFSETAATLHIARSSVSKVIQDLEAELGVRLIQRSTRKVSLTPSGDAFLSRSIPLVRDADAIAVMFNPKAGTLRGKLRVNVPSRIGRLIIAPKLPAFFKLFPGIELDLAATDRPVDLIGEGFDCVIRVGQQPDSGLLSRSIGMLAMTNCASPDYLATHGHPDLIEDLSSHRAIGYVSPRNKRDYGWEYVQDGKPMTFRMPCSVRVNNAEMYIACCLSGLGLIQVPRFDVRGRVDAGALVEVMPDLPPAPMPIAIVSVDRPSLVPTVKAFADWAEGIVKQSL